MRLMRGGGGGGGGLGGGRRGCGGSSGGGGGLHVRTPHRSMRPPPRSLPYSGEFAALGLTPFASRNDVKHAYKRLALKYHPDVMRGGESMQEKEETFKEIKSAYENLMVKFEEESTPTMACCDDEREEWDKWMGFEGGIPIIDNPS